MFGMGFMEIFLVGLVAIIALGPEKLPTAVVDIAKFFKKFKSGIDDAKTTLNDELNLSEFSQKADEFRIGVNDVANVARIDMNDIVNDEKPKKKPKKKSPKKEKKEKIITQDVNKEVV